MFQVFIRKMLNKCAEKQHATNKQALFVETSVRLLFKSQLLVVWLIVLNCKITCCSGNPLEPLILSEYGKPIHGGEQNSGIVTIQRIGQSAWLYPKVDFSQTMDSRQRLNGSRSSCKGLSSLRRVKIQSNPLGKLRGTNEHIRIRFYLFLIYVPSFIHYK